MWGTEAVQLVISAEVHQKFMQMDQPISSPNVSIVNW